MPSAGRFRLVSPLASGGMADLFHAVLTGPQGFERRAVVKRLKPELAAQEGFREMFIEEARLLASLSHPNVVTVLDFGEDDGAYWVALEYVEGADLALALKARPRLEPALTAHIGACVLRGLAHLHALKGPQGEGLDLVHRDVSPQNVLLSVQGEVKLADLGIAKGKKTPARTKPGHARGKAPYMSPEQALAQPLTQASDLFSTAVVLYELAMGRRPFDLASDVARHLAVRGGLKPTERDALGRACGAPLAALIALALSADPALRPAGAAAMARALEAAVPQRAGPDAVAELARQAGTLPVEHGQESPFRRALRAEAVTEESTGE